MWPYSFDGVDVGAVLDQDGHQIGEALHGRQMEFGVAEAELLKFRAAFYQQLRHLLIGTFPNDERMQDSALVAAAVQVRSMIDQKLGYSEVSRGSGLVERCEPAVCPHVDISAFVDETLRQVVILMGKVQG